MTNRNPYALGAVAALVTLGVALAPAAFAEEAKGEMQSEQTETKAKTKTAKHSKAKSKSHMKDDSMGKEANPEPGKN